MNIDRKGIPLPLAGLCLLLSSPISWAAEPTPAKTSGMSTALVKVYDGRERKVQWDMSAARPKLSASELSLLTKEILPKARKFWKEKEPDISEDFRPLAVFDGSFSAKGASQRLVCYQFQSSSACGWYGIVIIEDGKVRQNYCFQALPPANVAMLPDLNRDGCNEVVFESWSMHQGYRHGTIWIIEPGAKEVTKFGLTAIAEDDLNTDTFYKFLILARPATNPQFFAEKYQKLRNKWCLKGKRTLIKLEADDMDYLCP